MCDIILAHKLKTRGLPRLGINIFRLSICILDRKYLSLEVPHSINRRKFCTDIRYSLQCCNATKFISSFEGLPSVKTAKIRTIDIPQIQGRQVYFPSPQISETANLKAADSWHLLIFHNFTRYETIIYNYNNNSSTYTNRFRSIFIWACQVLCQDALSFSYRTTLAQDSCDTRLLL